eukprot:1962055-Rhodomonas_salina.2
MEGIGIDSAAHLGGVVLVVGRLQLGLQPAHVHAPGHVPAHYQRHYTQSRQPFSRRSVPAGA